MSGSVLSGRKTKVAVLIGTLEVGGAELDIVRNFPRLNRDEFEVVVVCFAEPGTLAPELERQEVRVVARKQAGHADGATALQLGWFGRFVHSIPEGIKRPLRSMLRAVMRFPPVAWAFRTVGAALYIAYVTRWVGRTLNAEQVDVAHFFLPHSYAYGMFACRFWRRRTKTVMSRLSLNFYKNTHKRLAWLERNVLHHRLDIAVGNSKLILAELIEEGVAPAKVRLLYNGIDTRPFARGESSQRESRDALGLPLDVLVIVAVGNLHTYKGHGDLIAACARVEHGLPAGWRLVIAGRDQEGNRATYERMVDELGLADHVSLTGPCDNVPQLLLAADLFVQPSHHEGLPNAVIEAMAASLPVIGTTVGGIPEAVIAQSAGARSDEETGWLVEPSDVDALGRALCEAAADPQRRAAMGGRAQQRAQTEFSLHKSVAMYESIYRELVR